MSIRAKKPKYKLQAKCSKLRWDEIRAYWWCCQTSMCYKHSADCPLIEALAKEVRKGTMPLNRIMPISIHESVKQRIFDQQNNKQLSFNF